MLAAGERRLRASNSALQEALTGPFRDHCGYLLAMMLDHVDALAAHIEALSGRIDEAIAPFARQVDQVDEIPGIGKTSAQELIAEIEVLTPGPPTSARTGTIASPGWAANASSLPSSNACPTRRSCCRKPPDQPACPTGLRSSSAGCCRAQTAHRFFDSAHSRPAVNLGRKADGGRRAGARRQ